MIKHILAAALIVGATATTYAQSDTTRRTQPSQGQQQPSNQYNKQQYTPMQSSDVPTSLRGTLRGDAYQGWENGSLYRMNDGNGYWLSTGSGEKAQNFYFDRNGKAIQGPGNDAGWNTNSGSGINPGNNNGTNNPGNVNPQNSPGNTQPGNTQPTNTNPGNPNPVNPVNPNHPTPSNPGGASPSPQPGQ